MGFEIGRSTVETAPLMVAGAVVLRASTLGLSARGAGLFAEGPEVRVTTAAETAVATEVRAATAANGGKYAFGMEKEVIGLADEIGASHLMKDPNWKISFRKIIENAENELHFTLNGIDETPMQMILNPGRSNTNWEMNVLYESSAFENTIFHYGGSIYKGYDVFKIKP